MSDFEDALGLPSTGPGETEAKPKGKGKRAAAPKQKAKAKTPAAPAWPSPIKPALNFMPTRHRDVEYGRRARRKGAAMVLGAVAITMGWNLVVGFQASHLQGEVQQIVAQGQEAEGYLSAHRPQTDFHANYVDQREAVSERFKLELSPTKILGELNSYTPSGVGVTGIGYDLSGQQCQESDPFGESSAIGCLTVSGTAPDAQVLAQYVDRLMKDCDLVAEAQVTGTDYDNGFKFDMQVGYTDKAFSGRGAQFKPGESELAQVVKGAPDKDKIIEDAGFAPASGTQGE